MSLDLVDCFFNIAGGPKSSQDDAHARGALSGYGCPRSSHRKENVHQDARPPDEPQAADRQSGPQPIAGK